MTDTRFVSPRAVSAHYFRPVDFKDAFAVALKPREQLPAIEDGKGEMLCSALVFASEADLDAGRPTTVLPDTIVNVGLIFRQLVRTLPGDGVLAGYVGQGDETSYGTRPWLIAEHDAAVQARVYAAWNKATE